MRKRILMLGVVFVLLAAACSDSEGTDTTSAAAGDTTPAAVDEDFRIVLVTGDNHDPFYVTLAQGAADAGDALGVEVDWQAAAEWDVQMQIPVLNAVLATKPDALVVSPTDTDALVFPLQQFVDAGIVVITVDTDVGDKSVRVANLTSDNELGGKLAAEFLAEQLPAGAKVLLMGPQPGIFTTDLRKAGFEAAIADTDLEYIGNQINNDDPVQVAQQVGAVLQATPDLAGIFAMDTFNGEGSATAVQEAGLSDQVTIISFDAGPAEVDKLRQGVIDALIVQKSYDMGRLGIEFALAALRGETLLDTLTEYVIATADNIDTDEVQQYLYKALP